MNFVSSMAYINHNRTTLLEKKEQLIAVSSPGVTQTQTVEVVGFSPQTVFNFVS